MVSLYAQFIYYHIHVTAPKPYKKGGEKADSILTVLVSHLLIS